MLMNFVHFFPQRIDAIFFLYACQSTQSLLGFSFFLHSILPPIMVIKLTEYEDMNIRCFYWKRLCLACFANEPYFSVFHLQNVKKLFYRRYHDLILFSQF
jgi:hypothetical protein